MDCNVAAESTGRVLAVRLFNATQDPGMKDILHFMIARDTVHQQQWLAVIEELGGMEGALPIPNSFPQSKEDGRHNYDFFDTGLPGWGTPQGRWTHGNGVWEKLAVPGGIRTHGPRIRNPVLYPAELRRRTARYYPAATGTSPG